MFTALGSLRKDKIPEGIQIIEQTIDAFVDQGKNTNRLHLIVDMNRLGACLFNVKMEYTYFPPRSGKNHLFEMSILTWPENGFMWAVSSFPIEFRPQAEALANECGLRLADGIPTAFTDKGASRFPLDGETVFTLENIPGHQAYDNNPANFKRLKEEEDKAAGAIIDADRAKLFAEMQTKGYTAEQIKRILSHWEKGNEEYDEEPAGATKEGQHRHGSIK
jgi:hypothetical protein